MAAFPSDPRLDDALTALKRIREGATGDEVESVTLDCKEENGRRLPDGRYGTGSAQNDGAARTVAASAACLANSRGGVVLVGIADHEAGEDALVGAAMDAEWLRERVWEIADPRLAVDVFERHEGGARLLVVLVNRSYRLHRVGKRYRHRVNTQCVKMSAEDQRRAEEERYGYDWSSELSAFGVDALAEGAVDHARAFLRATGDPSRAALAQRSTPDLLRALGVLDEDGRLTNAGALLFVDAGRPLIDYRRRAVPGASSTDRLEIGGPLISAYAAAKSRLDGANDEHELQLPSGVRPRIRMIPDRAVREALVNALIHRDYRLGDPVDVEFTGPMLVVSSPGGFPPGINAENIISERSHPRNALLTRVFRSLRLAEQEGVGVDRMYRDMVSAGHGVPTLGDTGGRVRCALEGGTPSQPVVELMATLPEEAQDDVDLALILHVLLDRAHVAASEMTGTLQKLEVEAENALRRGQDAGLLAPSSGSTRARPRYRLSDPARTMLAPVLPYLTASSAEAEEFVVRHLLVRPRIGPQDVADTLGVTRVQGSRILRELREREVIAIGSEHDRGRGVFHVRGERFASAVQRFGL